jgi:hypothetical protein
MWLMISRPGWEWISGTLRLLVDISISGRISIFNGAHCLLIESICLGNGGRDSWIGCGGDGGGGMGQVIFHH